eukprot:TRINITY_DN93417_c0_g1_i1.p1 TRINITY_DN93417_c0_g1~~TRINITY_DN93417_c0_g1_i1.p1  ORF type:complete len:301 (+),score=31.48 TRINITY_DN93417_c0_g1_i1:22-924(+)
MKTHAMSTPASASSGLRWLCVLLFVHGGLCSCPTVPQMPVNFTLRRDMWTFWATESVWSGSELFGKVERRPSFTGTDWDIFSEKLGKIGEATTGFCWPWQHCNFEVSDCEGTLLYKASVESMQSLANPDTMVQAYKFEHTDGSYIGRTSQLPALVPSLGGIQQHELKVIFRDTGDSTVAQLTHDNTEWVVLSWSGSTEFPVSTGAAPLSAAPLSDPRIMMAFVSQQFRFTGWISLPLFFTLWILLCVGCCFGCRKYSAWKDERETNLLLRAANDMHILTEDQAQSSSLLQGNCCSGNRPK